MAGLVCLCRGALHSYGCGRNCVDSSKRTAAAGSESVAGSSRVVARAATAGTAADAATGRRTATAAATRGYPGAGASGVSRRIDSSAEAHAEHQTGCSNSASSFECAERSGPDWKSCDDFQAAHRVSLRSASFQGHWQRHDRGLGRSRWKRHGCEHGTEYGQSDSG